MSPRPSGATAMSMMGANQQSNAAALMMLQSQGLSYYSSPAKMFPPQMQQQQQSQNAQFYHASLASSKRFSEEEKQKLEKVFTDETQKPSTSRKRQLAEELGCPVPKVNNWFQNRRAREKQMHRVQAYEASRAADRAASQHGRPDDPGDADDDEIDEDVVDSDSESMASHSQVLHTSSKTASETDESSSCLDGPTPDSSNGRGIDSVTGSPAASPLDNMQKIADEHRKTQQVFDNEHRPSSQLQLDMSLSDTTFNNQQDILASSPETFETSRDEPSFSQTLRNQFATRFTSLEDLSGLEVFIGEDRRPDFFPRSAAFMNQRTPTITTSIAEHDDEMEGYHSGQHDEANSFSDYGSLSPDMDQTDLARTQDCAHTSIASRRKTRPPQRLNQTALRDFQNGPKTGIEDMKRTDVYRTMRRAASANGPLSGKIFKSAPPISPRSPRAFGTNFLEQLTRHSALSAAASQFKDTSSASPAVHSLEQRYLSAGNPGQGLQHRSSSLSLNSYAEKMSLSPSTSEYKHEASLNHTQNLGLLHFQNSKFAYDTGCGNISPDDALATPNLSQFGSELDFSTSLSAPRYVESEPTTPSYVPVTVPASSAAHSRGYPTLKIETPPQANSFPWSRSPDHFTSWSGTSLGQFGEIQSQTFQFQPNITPSNFQSPTGT
ncbi:unnamed protein product [Discula destructiva]